MELSLISFSAFLISFISLIEQGFSQKYQPNQVQVAADNKANLRKCYVCNSHQDPFCSDEKWDKNMVAYVYCHENIQVRKSFTNGTNITHPFVCRKVYQKATMSGKTDIRISRTCGYLPPNKRSFEDEDEVEVPEARCYKRAGTYEVMVTYCTCLEDGCNGGLNSLGRMGLWILLVATLVSTISRI